MITTFLRRVLEKHLKIQVIPCYEEKYSILLLWDNFLIDIAHIPALKENTFDDINDALFYGIAELTKQPHKVKVRKVYKK